MVLVNAIYFYAPWAHTFDPDRTRERSFTRADGSAVRAELMRHDELTTADHYAGADTTVVALPYANEDLAFLALKPADAGDDFHGWEADLDRDRFDTIVGDLESGEGVVEVPKFEDEGEFDLVPAFEALGMADAFDSRRADFGRMADLDAAGENLYIGGVFHDTFIEVREEGTEAAAATGVEVGTRSAPAPDFEVRFDRPFVYALYDRGTDSILFFGRMLDPS